MHRYIIILLLTLSVSLQAEMKCEAGKCTTGKSVVKKDIPKKGVMQKEVVETVINTEKHTKDIKTNRTTVEQLFNVRTVKVKKLSSAHRQTNYGYIVEDESLRVDVVAWYSGFVDTLYADTLYNVVKKGEALAKVYSPEVYKAKQDYLNSIKFNDKRPSSAMLKSARVKLELLGISPKEIELIKQTLKVDRFTTIHAPASGWIFKKDINSTIHAPASGWIFKKDINRGSSFNTSKRLFEIVSLKRVWMEVKLYQNELEKISQLNNFTVKVKGINKIFEAKKPLLYPMLDPKEATATLRLELDNGEKLLKPGMYAKVSASSETASHLVIPRTAAMRKNGTWYAFLATEFKGEYEPIQIEVKPLDNTYFELLSGLNEGDSVVNNALFMMDSDAQINGIY
jgi:Cu(I)/Ag(I) efflux system membrane fusion protein